VAFRDAFPILHTPDLARALAFYRDLLGFEERYRFPEEEEPAYISVALGELSLGLVREESPAPPGRVTLWLYADDVDAEIERLRGAGIRITMEPADQPWGERLAAILDPDENPIHIGQRL
jgi:lactoylglutathione lyase